MTNTFPCCLALAISKLSILLSSCHTRTYWSSSTSVQCKRINSYRGQTANTSSSKMGRLTVHNGLRSHSSECTGGCSFIRKCNALTFSSLTDQKRCNTPVRESTATQHFTTDLNVVMARQSEAAVTLRKQLRWSLDRAAFGALPSCVFRFKTSTADTRPTDVSYSDFELHTYVQCTSFKVKLSDKGGSAEGI